MSLNSIMNIGLSGLMTAQNQLGVTSDNISNVNTPGYIRKVATQQSVTVGGVGMGVQSGKTTLAADQYLEAAVYSAAGQSSQADASYELLDQIQARFGDITDSSNLFNLASTTLSDMSQAAETASSSPARQQVVSDLTTFLNTAGSLSDGIQQVRANADSQIGSDVSQINSLLKNITDLNASISSAMPSAATGATKAKRFRKAGSTRPSEMNDSFHTFRRISGDCGIGDVASNNLRRINASAI